MARKAVFHDSGTFDDGGAPLTFGSPDAADVAVDSTNLVGTGTDVQAVLEELDNGIADHLADTSAAHAASAISYAGSTGLSSTDVEAALDELDSEKVAANAGITGATKTKITYDAKGLVTAGADATTADIADSTNKRYVTDAQQTVLGNTSGTNTGDQTSVSGNAGTATKLAATKNIDGQAFDGSADITVIAPGTHAATSKATPVDADELPLVDSAASNVLKKLTWANVKATLKTYFDTLYSAAGAYAPGGTDVAVADGGTGASTAAGARTNLGVPALTDNKSLTSQPAIANTETVVISYTCAANELAAGTTFRFKAFSTRAGTNNTGPTIRIRVGTTTLTGNIAATLTVPANALAVGNEIEGLVTVITNGSGGTIRGSLVNRVHLAAVTIGDAISSTAAVAVDTTAANMLIELTFISGNAANTYTFQNVTVEKVVS